MTVADMSLITAEVKVDETDIVNVKLGQLADVTIDAMPNQTFKGHVIGDRQHRHSAIHRFGGVPERHVQSGGQGLQGGDRAWTIRRTISGRASPAPARSPPRRASVC